MNQLIFSQKLRKELYDNEYQESNPGKTMLELWKIEKYYEVKIKNRGKTLVIKKISEEEIKKFSFQTFYKK